MFYPSYTITLFLPLHVLHLNFVPFLILILNIIIFIFLTIHVSMTCTAHFHMHRSYLSASSSYLLVFYLIFLLQWYPDIYLLISIYAYTQVVPLLPSRELLPKPPERRRHWYCQRLGRVVAEGLGGCVGVCNDCERISCESILCVYLCVFYMQYYVYDVRS